MLRRIQPIAAKADSDAPGAAYMSPPAATTSSSDRRQGDRRQAERRQGERRGMEALRAEALQSVIAQVADKNFGGLRSNVQLRRNPRNARMVLLVVAAIAGGLAAFLAVQRQEVVVSPAVAAQPAPEVVMEPRAQVLVARDVIGVGERLTEASLAWEDWPEGALRPEYITSAKTPEAITEMTGALARDEFYPGEPIRSQKLIEPGSGGHLSAVLEAGKRAVSVTVAAASASGGFIVPNDHVDVVLTRAVDQRQISETVLTNVRVLAVNARLGSSDPAGGPTDLEVFTNEAIATLELDATQTEIITSAMLTGQLSLALRSMVDFSGNATADLSPANQAIRMSSPFWAR